jgi:Zn-dependent protease
MRPQIPLGRIGGVRVGLHWSVVLIAILLTDILAAGFLPAAVPDRSRQAYVAVGAATALLFVTSILGHELAHALLARRRGVKVGGVTLWALGGFTELEDQPRNPSDELAIAGVGPLTSLGIGALALGAAGLADASGHVLTATGLVWLAAVNVTVAVFNVLPAAPLDGGRIARALLWRRSGDRERATKLVDRSGRVLGGGLIALGLLQILSAAVVAGIWLVAIGWIIATASAMEETLLEREEKLAGIAVAEVMDPPEPAVAAGLYVDAAAARLVDARCETAPVVEFDGRPIGFVTLDALLAYQARRRPARVRDVTTAIRDRQLVAPGTPLADVVRDTGGALPVAVVSDGALVGVLRPETIAWTLRRAAVHRTGQAARD